MALSFFGDGATNEGAFHEALNLAGLWKLPVIFFCENNLYGEGTPQAKQAPVADLAIRASSYAMPGVTVDGNDVLAVYEATMVAADRACVAAGRPSSRARPTASAATTKAIRWSTAARPRWTSGKAAIRSWPSAPAS